MEIEKQLNKAGLPAWFIGIQIEKISILKKLSQCSHVCHYGITAEALKRHAEIISDNMESVSRAIQKIK